MMWFMQHMVECEVLSMSDLSAVTWHDEFFKINISFFFFKELFMMFVFLLKI